MHLHTETWSNGGAWVTAKGFNIITQQDIHINIEPSDCVLLQCTGLKDKNGKLLYEGDIIQIPDPYKENTFLRVIIKWEIQFTHTGFWINSDFAKCSEVIGNIYENKELLQECE